ncbi:MAG: TIGR00282 family metallophosphoesterase [Leptolyngbya sp.]|nr:TIGR00282 family metallophosphoesterase [Candidatus Melainabacteria bacterium]
MQVLFLGDIIGKPGRQVVRRYLNGLTKKPDLIIANAENSAHGFGTTEANLEELRGAGVQAFTGGNHTFDRKELLEFIERQTNVIRPANYPEGTPGKGYCIVQVGEFKVGILNLIGRVFMEPLESPFLAADRIIPLIKEETNIIIVDLHAEATAEKVAMGWYLDGRVSAVLGTHTHIQTADDRVLPGGTAYLTDAGACGPHDGVIGMEKQGVFRRMVKQLPTRFEVAEGPAQLCGALMTIEPRSGKALGIERVQYRESEQLSGKTTQEIMSLG